MIKLGDGKLKEDKRKCFFTDCDVAVKVFATKSEKKKKSWKQVGGLDVPLV